MIESQVLYLGRWVSREHFRAFVYNENGQYLAKSYDEYSKLISSGLWQSEPYKKEPETKSQKEDVVEQSKSDEKKEQESNIVEIQPKKRGRKCHSQRNQ